MARREFAHSVRQDCFLREWRSPFVRVMAKQRQSAAPPAVMHLATPRWQAKLPQEKLPAMRRAKTAGWRPPLLVLPAQAKLLVTAADSPSLGLRRAA